MFLSSFTTLLDKIDLSESPLPLHQIGAQACYLSKAISDYTSIFVTVSDRKTAEKYTQYLNAFGITDVLFYPTPSLSTYEWSGEEQLSCHMRHHIRYRLLHSDQPPKIILTTYKAFTHLLMDNQTWFQNTLTLYPGDQISPQEIVQVLIQRGYKPSGSVDEPGEFTRRGAILDVYPVGLHRILRLEWFDDEIENIYSYQYNDTLNKPRPEKHGDIPPAYEWIIPSNEQVLLTKLQESHRGYLIESLRTFEYKAEHYPVISIFHPVTNFLGFLPPKSLIFWPEGMRSKSFAYAHLMDETAQQKQLPPQHFSLTSLKESLEPLTQYQIKLPETPVNDTLLPPIPQNLDAMANTLKSYLEKNYHISVVTPQPQRLISILRERDCPIQTAPEYHPEQSGVWICQGNLPKGFAFSPLKWFCFTDFELFQSQAHVTKLRKVKKNTSPIQLSQIKPGMLVVHEIHGIGRYNGLVQYQTTGQKREYLEVYYKGEDRLLVPVDQLNRLQLYHGVGSRQVKLNKLGGADWEKTKTKVKKALFEIAEDLLKTAAARQQAQGIRFKDDTEWQKEMEFAFPYEETPDQAKAIRETKADMEQSQPMNRLVCGDVGFGKTEVALRAAFKAAISGKQVALLAPTTILAHQHFKTLRDRFAPYPLRVDLLSRYKTGKEADRIFADLEAGSIDIIIATHRLLSKKLKFRDLGLLIIDEEHRFGVTHKEKLKQIQPNIDILTMSATPIPRTLNIALGGLKTLSLIETPPPNRHPIKTLVKPYEDEVVQKALYYELQRGGQVFYIHNRVKDIEEVGARIQRLVPQARVRIAHGQMSKQDLERTMWDFYNHVFDILICTTIVESGLDIPNCNTLIIERVELLGLAQIHQLRGRVGRSNIQAYAYLFYDPKKPLTKEAHERLTVVQEYTQLGAGYFLALKDMEIRGIGNIIGAQQHGNIVSVGFETYCQLLDETIAQIKGETPTVSHVSTVIDLNLSAYLPEKWIGDGAEKMRLYRSLAYAHALDYLETIKKEAIERFGPIPPEAELLWRITRARLLATELEIIRIGIQNKQIEVMLSLAESHWILACKQNKALKNWKYTSTKIIYPQVAGGEKNLRRVETLLDTLMKVNQTSTLELSYVS